jgi:putative iron-regulated protein
MARSHFCKPAALAQFMVIALASLLFGCDKEPEITADKPRLVTVQLSEAQKQQLSENTRAAWHLAEEPISRTLEGARQLQVAVENLLGQPSAATLTQAQEQWQKTALAYQPLRLYKRLPEIQPDQFSGLRQLTFDIGAQPIQPGYLDSVGPYAWSGLVHDISLPLSPEALREQHGMTSAEDASLGLFAVKFMLFGLGGEQPRQAADYRALQQLNAADREQGFTKAEELPQNRRRQLLLLQSRLLAEDLQRLHSLWQPDVEGSYYQIYLSYSALQRRALLLQSVELELNELLGQLTPTDAEDEVVDAGQVEGPDGSRAETAAESASPMLVADTAPAEFLAARLEYIGELLKTLQAREALQQSLEQALTQIQPETTAAADSEQLADAIRQTLELLTAEQQVYKDGSAG